MSMNGGDVRERVSGPATGLLVTGILGIVGQVIGLIYNLVSAGAVAQQGGAGKQPGLTPEQAQYIAMFSGTVGIIGAIVGSIIGIVIIMGALRMKKLESYGFAMTSAILAMIPCISPCCLLGLPIGIWAVVVLNKPEVKSAFHG